MLRERSLGQIFPEQGLSEEIKWCRDAELNCGHKAFQASALPTELSRHGVKITDRGLLVNIDGFPNVCDNWKVKV